jgi:hypothetical protein
MRELMASSLVQERPLFDVVAIRVAIELDVARTVSITPVARIGEQVDQAIGWIECRVIGAKRSAEAARAIAIEGFHGLVLSWKEGGPG